MANFVDDFLGIMGQGVVQDPATGNTALQSNGPSGCISIEDQNDYVYSLIDPNTGTVFHRTGDAISGNMTIESVCAELYLSDGFFKNYPLTEPDERDLVSGFENRSLVGNLNELYIKADVSASPGFSWGKSGNINSGTYLDNDTVPSNRAGRLVPISSGYIAEISVACENPATGTLTIQTRSGAVFTDIASISLSAQRIKTQSYTVSVSKGDELAVYVSSGSLKNPVVGVVIKGEV